LHLFFEKGIDCSEKRLTSTALAGILNKLQNKEGTAIRLPHPPATEPGAVNSA
jgi:hypothetical protein